MFLILFFIGRFDGFESVHNCVITVNNYDETNKIKKLIMSVNVRNGLKYLSFLPQTTSAFSTEIC